MLVFFAFLYALSLNTTLYTWGDNAHYIIVGKSLATGQGFTDILFPDNPPFKFPIPVFPLLLAPIIYFFDYDLLPLKIVIAVIGVGVVYLTYRLFKHVLDEPQALVLTLLVGVSPQIISFSHQIMTEIPYLFFSLLAALITGKYVSEKQWLSLWGFAAAVILSLTCLTKSIGSALILASFLYLLCETPVRQGKNYKKAFLLLFVSGTVCLLANLPILKDIAYIHEFLYRSPYTHHTHPAEVQDFIQRILENIQAYTHFIPEVILYYTSRNPLQYFTTITILLLIVGFIYCAIKRRTLLEYYIAFYFVILLLYEPSNSGNMQRYLVPIIPFIFYYFLQGLSRSKVGLMDCAYHSMSLAISRSLASLMSKSMGSVVRLLPMAAVMALILMNLTETIQASVWRTRPEMFDYYRFGPWQECQRLALWTKEYTPQDAIVMTRLAYLFHLWSQRKVVWYPASTSPLSTEDILQSIYRTQADYIVIDAFEDERTSPYEAIRDVVQKNPATFALRHQEGPTRLYHVITRGSRAVPKASPN